MTTKTTRLNRYLIMITLSVLLGLARYFIYDDTDFSLFSLVDKNKKEIKVNLSHIDQVKKTLAITTKKEVSYNDSFFLHSNDLAVFIDARDQDDIAKQGQILNSLTIPVSNIELVLNGERNDEGKCVFRDNWNYNSDYDCGYEDVLDDDFILDLEKVEWAEEDYPLEMKTINILRELDRKIPYIVYCGSSDCDKSEDLYGYMTEFMGFEKVMKFTGGWNVWKKEIESKNVQ